MRISPLQYAIFGLLLGAAVEATGGDAPVRSTIRLSDATEQSRIRFVHSAGGSGQKYLVELMVAGVATADFDGDGLVDIYFSNGAPLQGTAIPSELPNAMYRNLGDGTFADVTAPAGVGELRFTLGVAAADYDNDGDIDLYLSNYGRNTLYSNNGDGTFRDATEQAGVGRGERFGAGCCFLDIDGDGDLDLYAANYVAFSYARHAEVVKRSFPYPPGPGDYAPESDTLLRNNGDGTFTDISGVSGIGSVAGPSMGTVCADLDEDGDTDIFVCNDNAPNFFFRNDGRGHFSEAASEAGLAYDFHGNVNGGMGADCGDFDNDGHLDLLMTDYTAQFPVLYHNQGNGTFIDASRATGVGRTAFPHTKWGVGLVDFDNDGRRDAFIACGHFLENIREFDTRTSYRTPNILLWNAGGKKFVDVTGQCGGGMAVVESSRGAAFDDFDNDGDVDVSILNANARSNLLRNDTRTTNHWIELRLVGRTANRDGVGARVRVVCGASAQVAEVHSGRAYQSHFGSRLHFGLGAVNRIDKVEVQWLGGRRESFSIGTVDRCVNLVEGNTE